MDILAALALSIAFITLSDIFGQSHLERSVVSIIYGEVTPVLERLP